MFSPSRMHVDELGYGLGDQFCALLVEQPHGTDSTLCDQRHFVFGSQPDSRIAVTFLQNRWTPLHTGYAFFFTSIQDDSGFLPRQIAHSMRSSLSPHLRALCC